MAQCAPLTPLEDFGPSFRTARPQRLLLIQPIYRSAYHGAKVAPAMFMHPSLTLASLAGAAERAGHTVRCADLDLLFMSDADPVEVGMREVRAFRPDAVGITFNTCSFYFTRDLVDRIKAELPGVFILGGGVHCSSFPRETLELSRLDAIIQGEGDEALVECLETRWTGDWSRVGSAAWRDESGVHVNPRRPDILDLDTLALPAWQHFDLTQYKSSRLAAKASPVGSIETSRGCVYQCVYCNKNIFGNRFRVKSAERVVDEMKYMMDCGFAEINIMDDCFTTNIERAKEICRMLIARKVNAVWSPRNGLRVDKIDRELLELMKEAGCYRVIFGIESGNQEVLDRIKKKIPVRQVREAVQAARDTGLESVGYFMMGLPGENEAAMKDTIRLAVDSGLDLAKVSLTIPLPGTELYHDLLGEGKLKTTEWSSYTFYQAPSDLYEHDRVDWSIVKKYEQQFYRSFYLRPSFFWKRFKRGLREGGMAEDLMAFARTKWA